MFVIQFTQYMVKNRENRYRTELRKTQHAADTLANRLRKNPRITDIRVFHKAD